MHTDFNPLAVQECRAINNSNQTIRTRKKKMRLLSLRMNGASCLISRYLCMRSHYMYTLRKHYLRPLNEGRKHSYIISFLHLVLFRDGSSVDVFGWNSSKVFVNNGTVQ